MDSNAVIRTSHATDKARLEAEKQAITDQLALEAAATTKAQKVFEDLRAKLQLAQQETSHAKMMAIERQTAARMSEVSQLRHPSGPKAEQLIRFVFKASLRRECTGDNSPSKVIERGMTRS